MACLWMRTYARRFKVSIIRGRVLLVPIPCRSISASRVASKYLGGGAVFFSVMPILLIPYVVFGGSELRAVQHVLPLPACLLQRLHYGLHLRSNGLGPLVKGQCYPSHPGPAEPSSARVPEQYIRSVLGSGSRFQERSLSRVLLCHEPEARELFGRKVGLSPQRHQPCHDEPDRHAHALHYCTGPVR